MLEKLKNHLKNRLKELNDGIKSHTDIINQMHADLNALLGAKSEVERIVDECKIPPYVPESIDEKK